VLTSGGRRNRSPGPVDLQLQLQYQGGDRAGWRGGLGEKREIRGDAAPVRGRCGTREAEVGAGRRWLRRRRGGFGARMPNAGADQQCKTGVPEVWPVVLPIVRTQKGNFQQ